MRFHKSFALGNPFFAIALGVCLIVIAISSASSVRAANGRNAMLFGGLAVGAAGAAILLNGTRPVRAAPIIEEEEVVYRPAPRYVPTCRMERRRQWLDSESYTYRRVEVCE